MNNVRLGRETICYRIKASWHGISRMYNSHATMYDLSISVGYILLNLYTDKGIASTQIGPKLGMESRSLTRVLKSMEENGLIRREQDDHDKRQVNIFLTELGKEKKKEAKKVVKEFNRKLEDELSPDEIQTFVKVMNKINHISEQNFLKTPDNE